MALVQATLAEKKKKSGWGGLGSAIGSIGGGIAGGILGAAGGPAGIMAGAGAGSALGGKIGGVTGSLMNKGDEGYTSAQATMPQSSYANELATKQVNPKLNNTILEDALVAANDPTTPSNVRDEYAPVLINAYILNSTQLSKMNQGVA